MLIDFVSSQNANLYQRISDSKSMTFSSNNNLSIRVPENEKDKKFYEDSMVGGEDMYVCFHLLKEDYKFLIDRSLPMYHKPRKDLKGICKQFYNYGVFGCEALKNLKLSQLELFYNFNLGVDEYKLLVKFWFPIKGLIHIDFFNLHLVFTFLALVTQSCWIFYVSLIFLSFFLMKDFGLLFHKSIKETIVLLFSKYLVSLSFLIGGIKKSFQMGTIFIPPHITKSKHLIPAKTYIFCKNIYAMRYRKDICKMFDNAVDYEDYFEYIGRNNIRVCTDEFTVIIKRISLFFNFFIVTDFLKKEYQEK